MISVVFFALVMFSELSGRPAAASVPANKEDDGLMEPESLASLLGDDAMTERAVLPPAYRNGFMLDSIRDEDGSPNVIVVSDQRQKARGLRRLNPTFSRNLPLLSERKSRGPVEFSRRDTADLNILRCMIGRVYRPCWGSSETF